MKNFFRVLVPCLLAFSLSACGNSNTGSLTTPTPGSTVSETKRAAQVEQPGPAESSAPSAGTEALDETGSVSRQISVQFEDNVIIYELNDGTAADSLYEQLPLTVEVEDYSTNEKIFYPPQALDTGNSPLAQAGAGTLAYYEPWGDVVFFYGDYNENPSLFELGQVLSGGELVSEMSGTVTIKIAE